MPTDHDSQIRVKGAPAATGDSSHSGVNPHWEQMVLEIRECCDKPAHDSDEMAIARYLAGDCAESERKELEQTVAPSLDLSDCLVLARNVLQDHEPAA